MAIRGSYEHNSMVMVNFSGASRKFYFYAISQNVHGFWQNDSKRF